MFFVLIAFFVLVAGLVWFLLKHDRGSKEPIGALWAAAGFGLLSIIFAIVLEMFLPKGLLEGQVATATSLLSFLWVGIVEEAVKFFPLALFIYKKPYFNERTDGIIYFAISGIVFGLVEDIGYTVMFGTNAGLFRLAALPFFHAAGAAIIGYYLARAKVEHRSLWTVLGIWFIVALMHSSYDFSLVSGNELLIVFGLMITVLLNVGLFLFYVHANELDKAQGLSAVGKNSFCRACGKPNPHHNLYCEICGKRA